MNSKESKAYASLGASSSKSGVLKAVGKSGADKYFVELLEDSKKSDIYRCIHADGVGTKGIFAYLAYRETGDPSWFRTLAQDSLVMNLDDIACAGVFDNLVLSNTIGRCRSVIPDEVIAEIISGYKDSVSLLESEGISVVLGGGETADLGDIVRTVVIDSTLYGEVKKEHAISADSAAPGDAIIGFSSTGQARFESEPNMGVSSNGFTLSRHALIGESYVDKYPEIVDPALDASITYKGFNDILESRSELGGISIAKALLSPTRPYAPMIKQVLEQVDRSSIHGIINLTGGGQAKPLRFGHDISFVKDNLFEVPAVFKLIQEKMNVDWSQMYTVYNMGHRVEMFCDPLVVDSIIAISNSFGIEARQVGCVKAHQGVQVIVSSEHGEFVYE